MQALHENKTAERHVNVKWYDMAVEGAMRSSLKYSHLLDAIASRPVTLDACNELTSKLKSEVSVRMITFSV